MRATAAAIGVLAFLLLLSIIGLQHARSEAKQAKNDRRDALVQIGLLNSALATEAGKERIVTKYVDRVQTVYRVGATITKEIPRYVTIESDRACPVPLGFVVMHNAAATGIPAAPESAGNPDAPAPGVALSTVAEVVAENYTECRAIRETLIALQAYNRSIEAGTGDEKAAIDP